MRTYIFAIFIGIFCFVPYSFAELKLESVYPTVGKLGQPLNVTLIGKGFDASTRVSFFPDSGNKKSIMGSLDIQGSTSGVKVIGNIAYVSAPNKGLQIVDISMPSKPRLIGSVATSYASGVAVAGTTAYIADWDKGLKVIDVSDPTSPKIIGSVDTPGIAAVGVTIVGNIAYVADSDAGLQIINVSDPSMPAIIGTLNTPGYANEVMVVGSMAYIADHDSLQIADISKPYSPKIIGSLATPGEARGVTVVGNIAYVADGKSGLQIIDVSSPSMPQILGSALTPADAAQVTVIGNTAYVAAWESGLQIIDVSSPSNPKIIGFADTPSNSGEVAVSGSTAYVADGFGLQIIDVSRPVSSELLGSLNTPGWANSLTISGNFAYVEDGSSLQIINISNPSQPVIASTVNVGAGSVVIRENIAYITTGKTGLFLIDISNPYAPVIISSADTPGEAQDVSVVGTTAYVADNGLQIIDVGTPSSPKIIGTVVLPDYQGMTPNCQGVAVAGTTAYVTAWPNGLFIIDVSSLSTPKILSYLDTYGDPQKVRVIGNTAYVINGTLKIIDVSNPYAPRLLSSVTASGYAENVTLSGTMAYIADWKRGISVADVSNPSNPVIIGSVDTPGIASNIRILNDKAYVADGNAGLTMVPLPIEIKPVNLINPTSIFVTLPSPQIAGNYTIRVFNSTESYELTGAVTFLDPDSYQIQAQDKAIIIAGRKGPDDQLWEYTKMNADYAYNTLLFQGYTRENIYYLRPEPEDIDGDGLSNDVDTDATHNNFQDAVNVWANNPSSPAHDLLIYMVDHGDTGIFRINQNESISAQELDGWLDTITLPGKLVVIYDACFSGSFLSMTPPAGQSRIIITSTSSVQDASFSDNGRESFSFWFWNMIHNGYKLGNAFSGAKTKMRTYQTAQINDQTLADEISVGRRRIAGPAGPVFEILTRDITLNGESSATLRVKVTSLDGNEYVGIEYVHATVQPPDFVNQGTGEAYTDPPIELKDDNYDDVYEVVYDNFVKTGKYTIILSAKDKKGNSDFDLDRYIYVTQNQGIVLSGDINGDSSIDLKDAIVVLRVLAGINTTELRADYAASGADVNGNGRVGMEELIYILQQIAILR